MKDDYDKVGDYSVTGLLKSPRQNLLYIRHDDEITQDVSELAFMALGSGVHKMFEETKHNPDKWMVEERLVYELSGGIKISGKADLVDKESGCVYDFKSCSVWTYIYGGSKDWVKQMNSYRLLLHRVAGIETKSASIIALYRDWKFEEKERDKKNNPFEPRYPPFPIMEVSVPVLDLDKVENAIEDRVAVHECAEALSDNALPLCDAEERWARGEVWAVKKKSVKRAMNGGLFETPEEARSFSNKQKVPTDIEHRFPKNIKCERYCLAAPFCSQWQSIKGITSEVIG